ncbi:MAG: class I SAM-dependent methyltransferase [Fimbriimonas sp.]
MYEKSARFYDAIYTWKDYRAETARLREILTAHDKPAGTLLDVACGTGRHLELLKESYDVEGLELDPGMVAIARERVPGVTVTIGDMAAFDLGRRFDVVTCLFSSIGYMEEPDRLHAAIAAMAGHLQPDGVLVIEPWFYPHQFYEGHVGGDFHEGEDLKIARIARAWTEGPVSCMEMHHLVGTPGRVDSFVETHRMGLFTDGEYRAAFEAAGLAVEYDAKGLMGRGLYVGISRPS